MVKSPAPTTTATYNSYVICTSPRSGSTLLCKLLAATGVAGNPESYFHRLTIEDWLEDLGVQADIGAPERDVLDAIFKAAIAEGSLETGMFGLRMQRHSFDYFVRKLAVLHPGEPNDARRFRAAFGRTLFVHLTRRDKIEQAVSYVKAQQTGLWHAAPDGTELERLSPPGEPVYDADEIRTCFKMLTDYDRDWEGWFRKEEIAPLRITYDALSMDPLGTVCQILGQLGLDPDAANGIKPGVSKLADGINQDWAARFRSEVGMWK